MAAPARRGRETTHLARTPLFAHFHALVRRCRAAQAAGLPPEAWLEPRAEARRDQPSRRAIVQGAAAAAALAALPNSARANSNQPRVAVVGAGLAGLVAARTLKSRGIVATIFDSSSRVGGRVQTDATSFAAQGQRVERGGELIDTGHRALRKLVRQLGLETDDLLAAEPAGTQALGWFAGQATTFAQFEQDFAGLYQALHQDVVHAPFPTTYDSYTPTARQLDLSSIDEWIELRVPGGLQSRLGRLLSTAYDIEYGAPSSQQSALNLIYLLGYGSTPNNFSLFGESDERFRVRGGNEQVVQRLAAGLPNQTRLQHKLVAVSTLPNGRIRLVFDAPGGVVDETWDRVVMTVPFAVLRAEVDLSQAALRPLKRVAIAQQGMGVNAKLHVQFSSRHWHQLGCNGETFGDGFQNTWDETRAQAGAAGILDNYLGSAGPNLVGQSPSSATGAFLAQIEPLLPGLASRWTGLSSIDYWPGSPHQRGSYSHYKPGQYTTFAGVEREAEGRLHFAGEHTSIDFQGYMEGAVESGERAAREVLAAL